MESKDNLTIKVDNVSKDFVLPQEGVNSVKGLLTGLANGRKRGKTTQHALREVSIEIEEGEFFGIVGRNGSGKSTLLKILAGIYQPTKGSVTTKGKMVPFIELGVGFNPELTGRENIYLNGAMLGFSQREVDEMYDSIVSFAELEAFMEQKLKNYSSGMQVRLAFSLAIRSNADILLIDEVLAVGDADFQRKCFDYFQSLKKNKKTVVFVSHDMSAVREYCDRAVLIENSKLVYEGDAETVASKYTRMFLEPRISNDGEAPKSEHRWGDKAAEFTDIDVEQISKKGKDLIRIKTTAKINSLSKVPIFGFSIRNGGGTNLLGTNTQIKNVKMTKFKPGEIVDVVWEFDNSLNDGTYYVEPSIIYDSGTRVADWWEEAATFKVLKEEKVPYPFNPEINVEVKNER
jgi:ABC-2 type transport system ATP-binding protein